MENRICSIEGCGKEHYCKDLCCSHYRKDRYKPKPRTMWKEGGSRWKDRSINKPCKFNGCKSHHYSKGYCRTHYAIYFRKGVVEYERDKPQKKCDAPGCENLVGQRRKYCVFHYERKIRGVPFNRPKGIGGKNNPRMKKIRKEILEKANYICSFCGKFANQIHHLDMSKDNHDPSNLVACCHKCNHQYQKKYKKYDCKYRRLYGLSITELRKKGFNTNPLMKTKTCTECLNCLLTNKQTRLICNQGRWGGKGYIVLHNNDFNWEDGPCYPKHRMIFKTADECKFYDPVMLLDVEPDPKPSGVWRQK